VTTSVAAPGGTNPSDATVSGNEGRKRVLVYCGTTATKSQLRKTKILATPMENCMFNNC